MKVNIFNPITLFSLIAICLGVSTSLCAQQETWKGTLSLPRGDQKAETTLDFGDSTGVFQLPDLIPVPLRVTNASRVKDSVFFTVGFRSGPTRFKARISGDKMEGFMYSTRGNSKFSMNKTENPPSIFGRPKPGPEVPMVITTHANTSSEIEVKGRLESLLKKYDLEKYLYTKEVKIQDNSIPHSHPILVLNTDYASDVHLLSTFLHEQMHWYTLSKEYDNKKLGEAIFTKYPKVPGPLPEGAGDERSTYLHILVCYLEYHTLEQVVGPEKARAHMEYMGTQYYKWVFQTVVKDYGYLKELVESIGLHFD